MFPNPTTAQEGESSESLSWTQFDILCAPDRCRVGRDDFTFRSIVCELDRVAHDASEDLASMKRREGLVEQGGPRGQSLSLFRGRGVFLICGAGSIGEVEWATLDLVVEIDCEVIICSFRQRLNARLA